MYGKALTVKIICSKDVFVEKHFENLKKKFRERGYPIEVVEENFNKGRALDRVDLLKLRTYPSQAVHVPHGGLKPKCRPTFIIKYNPHNPPLK